MAYFECRPLRLKTKKGLFDLFGLPRGTNAANQCKSLISNAVLSIQRQKKSFFDTLWLVMSYKCKQMTRIEYFQLGPIRPKLKRGLFDVIFGLLKAAKCKKHKLLISAEVLLVQSGNRIFIILGL